MSVIGEGEARGGPVFKDISAEEDDMHIIESLCMNCHEDGSTRLLLTRIPFFKEVIISSFTCPHCNWSNTEIQSAGRIQEQGIQYTLKMKSKMDINREVVRAESATTRIPELDFEIPAFTQKGSLSTIEGLIDRAVTGLEQDQAARRVTDQDVAAKIDEFIAKLKKLKDVESEFTLVIDDPSGNSFVENPCAPQKDPDLTVTHYKRTEQQNAVLGIQESDTLEQEKPGNDLESLRNEVLIFNTNCPECNAPANTNMKLVQIPHFKEVVIMATNCESCGNRTNEVKSGGATEEQGTRITLHLTNATDMTRDLLKSETCSILVPEVDFELGMGALAGKFTTVEGLLTDIKDLVLKNPFTCGDSTVSDRSEKITSFADKIDQIMAGELSAHLVLDDPAGNSYIQNVFAPDADPEMKTDKYTRSFEQNEDLGLNDMKTEGYEA
ncbi:zinc finger protein ZPR1-like [Clupea harengus]|uniref:Zinc finger protein ZPR1 n=1 Tax=Clupea harengus TaxID=7950 RepID=A0A6P3W618_CLUHA|nr:zinc finger protein ZPR1 [Clupea harengus]XP_031418697.1 zinc finger protein ZPR1-like [Clupea harengus]